MWVQALSVLGSGSGVSGPRWRRHKVNSQGGQAEDGPCQVQMQYSGLFVNMVPTFGENGPNASS